MIFIDSNVPMHLVGAAHRHKTDSEMLLERMVAAGERLVTDAEVLQESSFDALRSTSGKPLSRLERNSGCRR